MTDAMDHQVTRRELREELARYPTKDDLREELARYPTKDDLREQLQKELARYATKDDLVAAKNELRAELASKDDLRRVEHRFETTSQNMLQILLREMDRRDARMVAEFAAIRGEIADMRGSLHSELAQHTRAIEESTRAQLRVLDDKYADLPSRVSALEAERERR
jgi:hypothetical protein